MRGLSIGCKFFSSNFMRLRQSVVINSAVLPMTIKTRFTFFWPILIVTTNGSVWGCCSNYERVTSNFITGLSRISLGSPFIKIWTLSLAALRVGYSSFIRLMIILMTPRVSLETYFFCSSLKGLGFGRYDLSLPPREVYSLLLRNLPA